MQTTSKSVAPALKALLERIIDYAGVFPPAALTLDVAVENFERYSCSDHSWMLRWLVVRREDLPLIPERLDGSLSVISDMDENRAATIESKSIINATRPVYCEIPIGKLSELDKVKAAGLFAKIRTGGVRSEMIPRPEEVTDFIVRCAELRLPFKATAGLHHPLRSEQSLTYESTAPRAVLHGFVNVLMASCFAWHGERHDIEQIIADTDPTAFRFDKMAHWRDKSLDVSQIKEARAQFVHSIGSCSFDEPVNDLAALSLL